MIEGIMTFVIGFLFSCAIGSIVFHWAKTDKDNKRREKQFEDNIQRINSLKMDRIARHAEEVERIRIKYGMDMDECSPCVTKDETQELPDVIEQMLKDAGIRTPAPISAETRERIQGFSKEEIEYFIERGVLGNNARRIKERVGGR